ncbi:putative baseplate assembly protein [Vibrio phage RYC]|nr:putative baseplate assembly protein [Vibrio phage RYC]
MQYDVLTTSFADQVADELIKNNRDIRIAIPARITNIDEYEASQCVTVLPEIDEVSLLANGQRIKAVPIPKMLVRLQEGGGFKLKFPVRVNDPCVIYFSHRDLSDYIDGNGDRVDSSIESQPTYNDGWVELGFGTRKNNQNPSATDLILEGDSTTLTITPAGQVTLDTESKVEVTTRANVRVVADGDSYLKSSKHTIDTDTEITGNLVVKKNTTVEGTSLLKLQVTAETGIYSPNYSGLNGTGGQMTIGDATITNDAVIGNISYLGHVHDGDSGGTTSTPK